MNAAKIQEKSKYGAKDALGGMPFLLTETPTTKSRSSFHHQDTRSSTLCEDLYRSTVELRDFNFDQSHVDQGTTWLCCRHIRGCAAVVIPAK